MHWDIHIIPSPPSVSYKFKWLIMQNVGMTEGKETYPFLVILQNVKIFMKDKIFQNYKWIYSLTSNLTLGNLF